MLSKQYEQLVESLAAVVWESDARTFEFTFVSQHARHLLGHPPEQWLTPRFWVEHLHDADRDRVVATRRQAVHEKRDHADEYRMIGADGEIVWVRDVVTMISEGDGVASLRGIIEDVSQPKRQEEVLRESESFYRLLMDSVSDFVRLHDIAGRSVYSSPSVDRLYAQSPDHL
ncbi:MAG: Blue-light-activated protein, partial [Gemmatimonadetes bacterium]|nr:Blue-light-activated protein [Gemmatimonadota bacterium]